MHLGVCPVWLTDFFFLPRNPLGWSWVCVVIQYTQRGSRSLGMRFGIMAALFDHITFFCFEWCFYFFQNASSYDKTLSERTYLLPVFPYKCVVVYRLNVCSRRRTRRQISPSLLVAQRHPALKALCSASSAMNSWLPYTMLQKTGSNNSDISATATRFVLTSPMMSVRIVVARQGAVWFDVISIVISTQNTKDCWFHIYHRDTAYCALRYLSVFPNICFTTSQRKNIAIVNVVAA